MSRCTSDRDGNILGVIKGRLNLRRNNMDKSEIGKALSAMRRTDIKTHCNRCNKPITGTTKARWCSAACSQAAYRARKRELQTA